MKNRFVDIMLAIALLAVVISGFSYTWTQSTARWGVISMSADGRIICACPSTTTQLSISRDWGQTWSTATNAPPAGSLSTEPLALSAAGNQIIACLSSNAGAETVVCRSSDFGTNWAKLDLPSLSGYNAYCVASSASGSNALAAANLIYFSTNSGLNWSTSSAPNANWRSIASSADAGRMVAAAYNGSIYVSTNFGASWTSNNLPAQSWNSVCVSADGQSIGATSTKTYISRDGGASWMTNSTVAGNNIACSANGTIWMIAGQQLVYTSSDGGVTWLTNLWSGGWNGGMSADGDEIFVAQGTVIDGVGGGIWAGHTTPSPQLNLRSQDTNLTISWLLPSTNFVLQQSSDLATTNWTTVPTAPTLNFSNLQQEVTMPAPASNTFYRLIAQ